MRMRLTAIAVLAATLLLSVPFTGAGMAAESIRTNSEWAGVITSGNEMTVVFECDAQGIGAVVAMTLRCQLESDSQVFGSGTSSTPGPVAISAGTARLPLTATNLRVCAYATAYLADGRSMSASSCS